MSDDLCQKIAEAIGAPGRFVERADGGRELLPEWQARAALSRVFDYVEANTDASRIRKLELQLQAVKFEKARLETGAEELRARIAELVEQEGAA